MIILLITGLIWLEYCIICGAFNKLINGVNKFLCNETNETFSLQIGEVGSLSAFTSQEPSSRSNHTQ